MKKWHRAASLDDFNYSTYVTIKGKDIALFKQDDKVYALEDICSHEFSRLSEGDVWGGKVYCAKHGSAFDLATGNVQGLPATEPVGSFSIKVEDNIIYVEL